jgi:hypothetical protein
VQPGLYERIFEDAHAIKSGNTETLRRSRSHGKPGLHCERSQEDVCGGWGVQKKMSLLAPDTTGIAIEVLLNPHTLLLIVHEFNVEVTSTPT